MSTDAELERLLEALNDAEFAYYAAITLDVPAEEFNAADLAYDAAEAAYDNHERSLE
jgi:hypothetical protein